MSDNTLCFSSLIAVLVAIGTLFHFARSVGAHSREKRDSAQEGYLKANTWDEKVVFFVFNVIWLIFVGGVWTFLSACAVAALSVIGAICGNNPWPYILEMWRDVWRGVSDNSAHGVENL